MRSNPDGYLLIYDLATGQELKHLNLGKGFDVAGLNPDDTRLAGSSSGANPQVEIYDLASGSNISHDALSCACDGLDVEFRW